ncbi:MULTISPECIES: hypothetical protein [unclassified Streptomyces]|uniref:hypothetical protein n=1 Tax=unclassified Streptomyces TaxID=2593676 RepID=UPI002E76F67F|nr:hypothetical protein [Streptomyces sp. JV176]MEE1804186.1 hypothetical protein [Streptomyces sp. JV176]
MTFDEEWAELHGQAAERAHTRLNTVASPGSGGAADSDLSVNRDDLGAIGHDAYELRTRLTRDGDHARPATFDAAIALTNESFVSGSALLKVHDRWNTQLRTLLDACAQVSNHLNYTRAAHANDDVQIAGDLMSVSKLNQYMK